ncbi:MULTISPECIES: class A sortase [Enterococcus]|uniref:class A sortase n=1 Tax=Enterococcus sp. AZ103 TaxID=2774628 RepID=UPI003F2004A5
MKKIVKTIPLILLLLIGLALIFNNQIKNFIISKTSEQYQVSNVTKKEIQENKKKKETFDFDGVQPISSEAVLKAKLSNKRLPVIGGVAIPSVAINLPIFKGLSNEALLWGAGTTKENQQMGVGNYGLASHHAYEDDLLFSPLGKVNLGATIYLTDLENIYEYKVTSKEKVDPTAVQWLDEVPDKSLVTLVTCGDVSGINRVIVQGELQQTVPVLSADKDMTNAFNMEEKTY